MGASVTVTVDRQCCMGSGMCVVYAPGTFDLDGAAKAVARYPSTDEVEMIRAAVEACPTGALRLVADEQGA